jgi:hypothetical protein
MKRIALAAGLATCFSLFAASIASADDTILRRAPGGGKDVIVNGAIEEETPAGVKIKVGKDSVVIPPEDILYIAYNNKDFKDVGALDFATYHGKEEQAMSKAGEERKKELVEVAGLYQALEKKVKGSANALRYVQYRTAMLAVQQAKDDPTKVDAAIEALNNYRTSNSIGWEIVPATKTVARLQEAKGDQNGARQAYDELAANPDVPKEIQLATNLLVARMLLHANKFGDAEQKLKSVAAGMKADDPQRGFVQVYLAQTAVAQGHTKEAEAPLRAALATATDDALKGLAYNALGDFYQQNKQPEEAFWQYLRVDVLYSQDREEHARALYNLWKLFESVRADQPRARECLDRLKDKSFSGTDYQARALKEAPEEKKAP